MSSATDPVPGDSYLSIFSMPVPDSLEVRARLESAPGWMKVAKQAFDEVDSTGSDWVALLSFFVKYEDYHRYPANMVGVKYIL